mmetsp:Transcript_15608/g.37488  ORF Transcript_15608/g.37488 Transcript_15608/m.37488 type:complete len:123 (+) Transcript_15608:156-524(+)
MRLYEWLPPQFSIGHIICFFLLAPSVSNPAPIASEYGHNHLTRHDLVVQRALPHQCTIGGDEFTSQRGRFRERHIMRDNAQRTRLHSDLPSSTISSIFSLSFQSFAPSFLLTLRSDVEICTA